MLAFRDAEPGIPGIRQRRRPPDGHGRHCRRRRDRPGLRRRPRRSAATSCCRLRRTAPSSPDQLADGLGASRTGVLQQLRALEAAGLVSRQTVRHGVGRPRHLYDVTRRRPGPRSRRTTTGSPRACSPRSGRSAATTCVDEVFEARRRQIARNASEDRLGERLPTDASLERPRPRARGDPGRAGLPRRGRPSVPTGRSGSSEHNCAIYHVATGVARPPARPSSSCSATSSAPTSCASRTSRRATAAAPTGSRGRPTA